MKLGDRRAADQYRPRILVTDAEERSSLAACRGLATAGYSVTGVARMRPASGHWSRSCDRKAVLPDPLVDPDAFVQGLEGILRERRHEVLLPSTDLSTWVISQHRERFEGLVRLALPDHDAVASSLDKIRLIEEATAAGISAPASIICTSQHEATAAAAELGYPLILKASRSFIPSGSGFTGRPVALVSNERTLAQAVPEFGSPFVVQRFERGSTVVSCSAFAANNKIMGVTFVRFNRRWPVKAGATSFCESIAPPRACCQRSRNFSHGCASTGSSNSSCSNWKAVVLPRSISILDCSAG